jgi:iron complex transport system substrate-binding protein
VRSVAARLTPQPTVLSLNPYTIQEVLDDIVAVGKAVDLEQEAQIAKESLEKRVRVACELGAQLVAARTAAAGVHYQQQQPQGGGVKVAFIEWSDPIYVGGHWTPQVGLYLYYCIPIILRLYY